MTIDINDNKHIIADEGKTFRRILDQMIFGKEIYLGKTWYICGKLLPEPIDEKSEDFEEIEYEEEIPVVEEETETEEQ